MFFEMVEEAIRLEERAKMLRSIHREIEKYGFCGQQSDYMDEFCSIESSESLTAVAYNLYFQGRSKTIKL